MQAPCQKFVLIPAMKVTVDPSVEQLTTNLTYVIKSTNAYVYNMFHHMLFITNMFSLLSLSSSGWLYKSIKNTIICPLNNWNNSVL